MPDILCYVCFLQSVGSHFLFNPQDVWCSDEAFLCLIFCNIFASYRAQVLMFCSICGMFDALMRLSGEYYVFMSYHIIILYYRWILLIRLSGACHLHDDCFVTSKVSSFPISSFSICRIFDAVMGLQAPATCIVYASYRGKVLITFTDSYRHRFLSFFPTFADSTTITFTDSYRHRFYYSYLLWQILLLSRLQILEGTEFHYSYLLWQILLLLLVQILTDTDSYHFSICCMLDVSKGIQDLDICIVSAVSWAQIRIIFQSAGCLM